MDHKLKFFSSMVFNKNVIKSIFGNQNLCIPEQINGNYIGTSHIFNLSDSYLNEWNDLFDSNESSTLIPYTYYWPWMMDYTMKSLLPDLGISLKNVLHLGHEAKFSDDFSDIKSSLHTLKNRLVDICPLSKNKITLVTETSIVDQQGKALFTATDHTVILNMKPDEMEMLKNSPEWDTEDIPFRNDSFRKKESLFSDSKEGNWPTYQCKGDLASKFGYVAGALSVTHASTLTAKYFRQGKVFLQGMCTGNIVLKLLYTELGESLEKFSIYFTNQLPFPQKIELRYDDTRFEVFDESNTMVAYGSRVAHVSH